MQHPSQFLDQLFACGDFVGFALAFAMGRALQPLSVSVQIYAAAARFSIPILWKLGRGVHL